MPSLLMPTDQVSTFYTIAEVYKLKYENVLQWGSEQRIHLNTGLIVVCNLNRDWLVNGLTIQIMDNYVFGQELVNWISV